MLSKLTYIRKHGAEISTVFDELAKLRINVFREYPYLYEGSVAYEKTYLQTYAHSDKALLFAVYDGRDMVGATTCIPLIDETPEIRKPFEDARFDLNRIVYFGESILLLPYRGLGLGHRFFDEREAHARRFGTVDLTCFCAVERELTHPAKPSNYRPNDAFWLKRGYRKEPLLQSWLEWPDLGDRHSTSKRMIYWTRALSNESNPSIF